MNLSGHMNVGYSLYLSNALWKEVLVSTVSAPGHINFYLFLVGILRSMTSMSLLYHSRTS